MALPLFGLDIDIVLRLIGIQSGILEMKGPKQESLDRRLRGLGKNLFVAADLRSDPHGNYY